MNEPAISDDPLPSAPAESNTRILDAIVKMPQTSLLSDTDGIAIYNVKTPAQDEFKANTLMFMCPVDVEATSRHPAGTGYAFLLGQSETDDRNFDPPVVDHSMIGTALIGDRNNIIENHPNRLMDVFTTRAEGAIDRNGSDPNDPGLIETVRKHVSSYCAPGS